MDDLNQFHTTIKFTHVISDKQVVFLDSLIEKGKGFMATGKLDISPHSLSRALAGGGKESAAIGNIKPHMCLFNDQKPAQVVLFWCMIVLQ